MLKHLTMVSACAVLITTASGTTTPASAQRADSAGTARTFMRQATASIRSGDTAGAIPAIQQAVQAWPRQGAYHVTLARVAARAGRIDVAEAALRRANAMGFAWAPGDAAFTAPAMRGALEAVAREGAALREPKVRSTLLHSHRDSLLHVEGVAVDPITRRMFTSSVRLGVVTVIDSAGREQIFATDRDAVFGILADPGRGVLWITTSSVQERTGYVPADSNRAAIIALDLTSGAVRGRWELPRTEPHVLGDVVLAPDGSVWASDSRTAGIWRAELTNRGRIATRLPIDSPDFVSLQGIAFDPGGRVAWIADWTTGLFRIDVPTGAVTPVSGDPILFTLGIDGLYREPSGGLIAIQNGIAPTRIVRLHLDAEGRTLERLEVLEHGVTATGEPTLGVIVGGTLVYVANAPWDAYGANGAFRQDAAVPPTVIRRLPL